jgi:trimeric autotransporter adhesin
MRWLLGSRRGGGVVALMLLTASCSDSAAPSVRALELAPASPTISAGATQQFTATALYPVGGPASKDVSAEATWESSDPKVATVSAGRANALAVGSAVIKATYDGVVGIATLTVTNAQLQSITVTPVKATIGTGTTQQLVATGTYSDATTKDLSSQVTWSASDTGVASVGGQGLVTAVKAGTTTITATLGSISGSAELTVTGSALQAIQITPPSPNIALFTTLKLKATAVYADTTTQDITEQVTWSSSDTSVATLSNITGARGQATGLKAGTTTVKAELSGKSGQVTLTVSSATLSSIAITPTNPTVVKQTSVKLTATGTFSDTTTQDLTDQVTWSSSNSAVASVSNATASKGEATGLAAGSAVIKAELGATSGQTTLLVTVSALTTIELTPVNPSVVKGTAQTFIATATYADTTTQDVSDLVTWSSSDAAVAAISNAAGSEGEAAALKAGTTMIKAELGGKSGQTTLTVTAPALVSVEIQPSNPTVAKGLGQKLTATATFADSSTQDVTDLASWSSSDATIATVSNAAGSKGLASATKEGSTTVTAGFQGKSGTTLLTVTAATIVSIAVTPTAPSIAKGTKQKFAAVGSYTDGSTQEITETVSWGSSDVAVAAVSNAAGSKGEASALQIGQTTISAGFAGHTGQTTLTVTAAQLTAIDVTPSSPSIAKGTKLTLTATGTYTDATTQDLTGQATWGSSNGAAATVSNAAGSKGETSALQIGQTTISASFAGKSGSTVLTVTAAVLSAIAVTPTNPSIAKGTAIKLKATGVFSDSTTQDMTEQVSWTSSDLAVATISNTAGKRGRASGIIPGTSTITATHVAFAVSGATTLTITNASLTSIEISPAAQSVPLGTTLQFKAVGVFSDATTQELTDQVTWGSSDLSVATVSNAFGTEGFAATVGTGGTLITASMLGKQGSTSLAVTPALLLSLQITPTNPSAPRGTEVQFTAVGTFTGNVTQDLTKQVTWSSSSSTIASVSNAAGSEGLAHALNQGSTTITASYLGKSGTTTMTVTPATLLSLVVSPTNPSVAKGLTRQMVATGSFSDGTTQDLTSQVTWTSSDLLVATVSNAAGSHGMATAVALGTTTIKATLGSISASTLLTVTAATIGVITVTPTNPVAAKGTTVKFKAVATFSDASVQDITTQATWASDKLAVAQVSNSAPDNGLASAVSPGTAKISATLGGKIGMTTLTVTPATLSSITVTPVNPTVAAGSTLQFKATGTFSDSSTQDITTQVVWSSDNTSAATISNAAGSEGLATGIGGPKTAKISATFSGQTGSTTLTVTGSSTGG